MQEFRAAEGGGQIRQLCAGEVFIGTEAGEECVPTDVDELKLFGIMVDECITA